MKKIISIVLICIMILQITPNQAIADNGVNSINISEYEAAYKVSKIINTGIIQNAINSERYAYWNFYISTDTNLLKAYGYRFSDAFYNLDFIKATQITTPISKHDAREAIEEFIVLHTQRNNEEYKLLADIAGLVDFIKHGAEAYEKSVELFQSKTGINQETINSIIQKLSPYKQNLELCLQRGEIDETTKAWILGGELNKTTQILHKADFYDTLIFSASLISNGLKVVKFTQDLSQKLEQLMVLKYASSDAVDLLNLLSNTPLDKNIKEAAKEVNHNLIKYKNANLIQLISYSTGYAIGTTAVDLIFDKLKDVSLEALKRTGIKGCMNVVSLAIAIEIGVIASNFLFNAGNTLDQINKIRVMSLISLALVEKVVTEQTEFVMSYGNTSKRANAAYEILKYLPFLLLSRELGEFQYYNMRLLTGSGAIPDFLIRVTNLMGFKDTTLDDWYKRTQTEIQQIYTQLKSIIYLNQYQDDTSFLNTGGNFGIRPVGILERDNNLLCVAGFENKSNVLIKIEGNTNEKKLLIDEPIDGFLLTDKHIYYYTLVMPSYDENVPMYGGHLKRANLDGSNIISVSDIQCGSKFIIKGNKIYYALATSYVSSDIYSCDLDGNNKKLLCSNVEGGYSRPIAVSEDTLYYTSGMNLNYVNLTDLNNSGVLATNVQRFNFDVEGIVQFYTKTSSELIVNRLNTEGKLYTTSYNFTVQNGNILCVTGDYIYYYSDAYIDTSKGKFDYVFEKLMRLNFKTQATDCIMATFDYSFINTDNDIFIVEDRTIKQVDPVTGQIKSGIFPANKNNLTLIKITDQWVYCYESTGDEGAQDDNLIRYNKKTGEKQFIGSLVTYRG